MNDLAAPIGWPLLPLPDANGELHYPSLEDSIRQQVQVILRTRPGEQLMQPGFGAGLENFLHEPDTLTTRRRIRDLVQESLTLWEPRISLEKVEVWDIAGEPGRIRVEIGYRVKRNGAGQSLGLTLETEA